MTGRKDIDIIRHVTWVGFWVNTALMVLKLAVGYWGHSDALVADGYHSLSDFGTDFIVLIFVGIAYKRADSDHPYGHGKFETLASLLIGVALLGVALGIGWSGTATMVRWWHGQELPRPEFITIIVAAVSILAKEVLYRYTYAAGVRIDSSALKANAWHHRSDAISSVATVVGVAGSYFLGANFRLLDPLASVLIAVFIAMAAWKVVRPALDELLEKSLPSDEVDDIRRTILSVKGVHALHKLKTRRSGHSKVIDVDIKVDPYITVTAGHDISTQVERTLRQRYGSDIYIYVHVEPFRPH